MIWPPDQDELADQRPQRPPGPPYDLMAICLAAICMAMLIGVSAGLVWLRLFGAV